MRLFSFKFWQRKPKEVPAPKAPEGFKLLYTDSKGNNWFTITNQANLHASRALFAWGFARDAEYGLSRERLQLACEKINEYVNKKDVASIAKVIGVIEAGLDLYAEPQVMLNLATCYTFLNDEANDGYKDFWQDKKREIWESDVDCRAFFLQWCTQSMQQFSALQKLNVLDYFDQTKAVRDQLEYQLPKKSRAGA